MSDQDRRSRARPPFARRDAIQLAAIALVALLARVVYVLQASDAVFMRHPVVDAKAYHAWAQRIVQGDWVGTGVFYQAPLYPYFLALVESIVGDDLIRVRLVQACVGAASCTVLALAARALFDRATALVAGSMLALYAPSIFFDALIQKSVLDALFGSLTLWLVARAWNEPKLARWTAVGVSVGLLSLTRENALLLALALAVVALVRGRGVAPARRRLARCGALLAGVALALLPVGARNLAVGGEFALTTSQAGPNFYIGNNPSADGTYAPLVAGHSDPIHERADATRLAEAGTGRRLTPNEVSSYWLGRAFDFIRSQPLAWTRLVARKIALLVNAYEIPDAEDLYFAAEFSTLLAALATVWHFGVLAPLAAAGVVATFSRRRELWVLHAIWTTLAFGVVAFYVFGRYRFPMVPVMTLFAAAAVVHVAREGLLRSRVALAVAALVAVASNWPIHAPSATRFMSYHNAGTALRDAGDDQGAIEMLQRALALDPNAAGTHATLGLSLARLGRTPEAIAALERAAELDPRDPLIEWALADTLARSGSTDRAIEHLRRARDLDRNDPRIAEALVDLLMRAGRRDQAIATLREAITELRDASTLQRRWARELAEGVDR